MNLLHSPLGPLRLAALAEGFSYMLLLFGAFIMDRDLEREQLELPAP